MADYGQYQVRNTQPASSYIVQLGANSGANFPEARRRLVLPAILHSMEFRVEEKEDIIITDGAFAAVYFQLWTPSF